MTKNRLALAAAAVMLAPLLASGQTDPKADLRKAVDAAVRPLLGDSTDALAQRLASVKPDGMLSRNFDLARVKGFLFPRLATSDAQDCLTTTTPVGERDPGQCVVEYGSRDIGEAPYRMLAFSKNIGIGDIEFARRDAYSGNLPPPVAFEDAKAYDLAMNFLVNVIGVPKSEIPSLPTGARLPVRSLVIGSADEKGVPGTRLVSHKVVSVPRAFVVPGGLGTGPNGQVLMHVLAPGGANVALAADGSVRFARVDGWSDAQMDFNGKPRTTTELVNAITDDLWGEGARQVGSLSVLIALRRAYPNPDDPNPPPCPVCGVLRPALKVVVAQAGRDRPPEGTAVAAGLVRMYDLLAGQGEFDRTVPR